MSNEKRPTLTLSKKKRDPNAPKVSVTRNPNVSIGVIKRTTVENNAYEADDNRGNTVHAPYDNKSPPTGFKKTSQKKPRLPQPSGVRGRMELTIKLNELPNNVQIVKNQWRQFEVKADDYIIRLRIRPKAWNKMTQANEQWESWVASISGKMGNPIKEGFELVQPAVQVYEKKPKQLSEEDES